MLGGKHTEISILAAVSSRLCELWAAHGEVASFLTGSLACICLGTSLSGLEHTSWAAGAVCRAFFNVKTNTQKIADAIKQVCCITGMLKTQVC